MKLLPTLAFASVALLSIAGVAGAQSWQPLTHQPSFTAGQALLLTDGTVMVHREDPNDGYSEWYKLTPDINGSYVNGTWSQIASLSSNYGPLFFASAVLADGKVIIEGGEQNFSQYVWTTQGAFYDPVANTWTNVNPPSGWSTIGDASGIVLFNKTFMLANCCTREQALFNESTLTWTPTGANKFDENDEEGWVLLPNGKVLCVDAYLDVNDPNGTNSELYDPTSGSWSTAGSTVVQLWDPHGSYEEGPGVLRPDGTVFWTGANGDGAGHTSIYSLSSQTWTPGPDFPGNLDVADGPAALLPDGNVLVSASPLIFQNGVEFFEWNGSTLTEVPAVPNSPTDSSWYGRMLVLPTGQVLYTDGSADVEIYNSTGSPYPGIAPSAVITTAILSRGSTIKLQGKKFNGASQTNFYGDDAQAATNYPIVRITNINSGHVFYCRTHDHSTMAVGYNGPTYTQVDIPSNMETGASYLEVVVNGIASPHYMVGVH
ncbi:MAG TPA: hypothetical protein VK976_14725 [Verrucomicrobiae bacterium]|jgi:hypothetical protein|nr:hypothetical protein [Verrucomicrobiae bacterium]